MEPQRNQYMELPLKLRSKKMLDLPGMVNYRATSVYTGVRCISDTLRSRRGIHNRLMYPCDLRCESVTFIYIIII